MLNFIKCFFTSIEIAMWFLFFSFVYVVTHIDLPMLNSPCELGIWRIIFFTCCWIWFANILLKIVASVFIKIFPCNFLIQCCLVLVILMDDDGFIESLWECFLFNFLEEFGNDRYKFFFVYLAESVCEAIWSQTFVCREFLNYRLYFTCSDRSVQIICLFLIQFSWVVCF